MKKFVSVICIILAFCLLCSCAKESGMGDYDSAADFTKEDGELYSDVPHERYDGYIFRILNAKTQSSASCLDAETVTGDNLNEAIFVRNTNVEERLDIEIEEIRETPEKIFDMSSAACLAGDGTYSAVCNTASMQAAMAVNGYIAPLRYLSGINLNKPWWNMSAIESASVDGVYFFFFGDIQLSYYDAHSMVAVNMDMVEEIEGMKNPYSLVDRGEWTFDAMLRMMQDAAYDVDGNAAMTYEDRYGAATDTSILFPLVIGCNTSLSARDEYGLPYMKCLNDEKFYDSFALVSDNLFERNDFLYDTVKNEADGMNQAAMFKTGRTLFYISTVGSLANLRTMDYEIGVLPVPKYTEMQTDYVSFISGDHASAFGVIATGRNLKRTSVILENMAAESHREGGVRQCFVDKVLSFRYVDDEKSRKNLMDILDSGFLDPADIYGWGGIVERLEGIAGKSEVFSSTLASVRLKSLSDISDTVENVNKYR
ncbi:MAG: hypothetical protein IJA52_00625 [Clostridia bacterium]|nr:hypothetical protein [Clostridia bacterium]